MSDTTSTGARLPCLSNGPCSISALRMTSNWCCDAFDENLRRKKHSTLFATLCFAWDIMYGSASDASRIISASSNVRFLRLHPRFAPTSTQKHSGQYAASLHRVFFVSTMLRPVSSSFRICSKLGSQVSYTLSHSCKIFARNSIMSSGFLAMELSLTICQHTDTYMTER